MPLIVFFIGGAVLAIVILKLLTDHGFRMSCLRVGLILLCIPVAAAVVGTIVQTIVAEL